MNNVYILSAVRTPIGTFQGGLSSLSNIELATIVVKEAINRANVNPQMVQNVVGGTVYKGGLGGNPARQVQIACNIPVEASASTVEQLCSSAMRALEIAMMEIQLGKNDIAVAYGCESMSNAPNIILNAKAGSRIGPLKVVDSMLNDGLECAIYGTHMGVTAENLAKEHSISREEQDKFALHSHQKAVAAMEAGLFDDEIVPVEIKSRKGVTVISKDEGPKANTTLEALSKLKPAFLKEGTVTAGNASSLNDGAAAVVLISEQKCKELGLTPLAQLKSVVSYGVEPRIMGIGPAYAIPKALKAAEVDFNEVGIWEVNEAFAVQCIAVANQLHIPMELLNPLGSGVSLGHPVGCTGIRLVTTLVHNMKRNHVKYGVASLCTGGGPAMASVLELI